MKTLKRWCAVVSLWVASGMMVLAQQPQQQGEFLPLDQLPPQDQMPAAPLLIAAYVFALVALFAYLFIVSRRLSSVQQEIERLDSALKQSGRA